MSLERKLPFVMTAVLAAVLGAALLLGYGTLRNTAESSASQRLTRAVHGVASTIDPVIDRGRQRVATVAATPGVRAAVQVGSASAGRSELERLLSAQDLSAGIELWSTAGQPIAARGPTVEGAHREQAFAWAVDALARSAERGTATVSQLFVGDTDSYYWTVAEVAGDDGRPLGYVAQRSHVYASSALLSSIRQMLGEEVTLAIRNPDGGGWSAHGAPLEHATHRDSTDDVVIERLPGGGAVIVAEAAIRGAPWVVMMRTPLAVVHSRVLRGMLRHTALALSMLVLGAGLAWVVSRRITRPIASLTTAAEAVARGDYSSRVHAVGGQELERLAGAFNQMAEELETSHRELEQRVREAVAAGAEAERASDELRVANAELEKARTAAERANQAKGNFLAVMSHELRTPLNAISGYVDLVRSGVYGPTTEGQREALVRIAQNQEHLLTMIEDVLDFAQVEAGRVQYDLQEIELHSVLDSLEAHIAPQLRERNLEFRYRPAPPDIRVRADRQKLRQVMVNLLTNAIKFTPPGGQVLVETERVGIGAVAVHVRDTGVGIPPERRAAIFEAFVQGDRTLSRPQRGVGLGLAIGRQFARAFGGELSVESEVGIGSTFTLTLHMAGAVPAGSPELESTRA